MAGPMRLNLPFTVKRPIVFNICALLCLGAAVVIGGLVLDTMHADNAVYWGDSDDGTTVCNDWSRTSTTTATTSTGNGSNNRADSSSDVNGDTSTTGHHR
jgi:hypothetical protein